ncbi:MAG: 16S rRNA (cytidine(1402)-2'-O)-methyltransferase [Burkholderiales bacterium]
MSNGLAVQSVDGGELFIVATPIGNLEDMSLRAIRILKEVDVVAAEDTRVTAQLLARYAIAQRPLALHAHNERERTEKILGFLRENKRVALVSDAGTPGISDPGAILVKAARDAGFRVTPIPGPSALAAALSVAGFVDERVLFCGFLPAKASARRQVIADLGAPQQALVFYEAPHRVIECVEDLAAGLPQSGERRLVIAREITKLYESVHECLLDAGADWLRGHPDRVRGEFVLLVSGLAHQESAAEWEKTLQTLLAELPLAQAVRLTCAICGVKRKPVYERALELKADR